MPGLLKSVAKHRWKAIFFAVFCVVLTVGWYHQIKSLPDGLNHSGWPQAVWDVRFHGDLTYLDSQDIRHHDQEIFDEILAMIAGAQHFILLDMFLFNDYTGAGGAPFRNLSKELTEALLAKKASMPEIEIIFITDPVNTVYGGLPEAHLEKLKQGGIDVVMTDLTKLRDSNPIYSAIWRPFLAMWGNGRGTLLPNPLGRGRVSLRSYLRLLNFKANHRKVIICDDGQIYRALVTSANPHDASSAHDNVALSFSGPAVWDVILAEFAVLKMSGHKPPAFVGSIPRQKGQLKMRWLTERAILNAVVAQINALKEGERLDMMMFYLSHKEITSAMVRAKARGAIIRVLLDPNKDAFGRKKNGIPNRQIAAKFIEAGIEVRWADTHGEQCHSKMLIFQQQHRTTLILGSANLTRRNLNNYNLEANALVSGTGSEPVFKNALIYFQDAWSNRDQRHKSVTYEAYADNSTINKVLYYFMETWGLSTF